MTGFQCVVVLTGVKAGSLQTSYKQLLHEKVEDSLDYCILVFASVTSVHYRA